MAAGLTASGVWWAIGAQYASNWHPLAWVSHMLDVEFWGLAPAGHHAVNIAWHAANAAVLFLVLARLTGAPRRSALVSALFAVHPLHVETVAWVAERKDLLCTFFSLLTVEGYRRYCARPGAGRCAAVAALFALALASKPMAVTLPVLLLLLDYWPLQRLGERIPLRRLLLEKAPLLLLAALASALTVVAQRAGGSLRSIHHYALDVRVKNALVSYVTYLAKAVWPVRLSVFYPHPGPELAAAKAAGAALLLLAVSAWAIAQRRQRPWLLTGWLWFVLTLGPVIGLVQVGDQGLADRYTYVPLTGIFIAAVWGAAASAAARPRLRPALAAAAVALLLALGCASRVQVSWWKSGDTLFARALAVTRDNWFAHISLAGALGLRGDLEGAAAQYGEALRIRPRDPIIHNNLGFILGRQGKLDAADAEFQAASALKPDYPEPIFNAGVLALKRENFKEAESRYQALLAIDGAWAEQLRQFIGVKRSQTVVR